MSQGRPALLAAALIACASPALAINKCTQKDGKVVYQDAPCQNTSTGTAQVKTWGAGQAAAGAVGTTAAGFKTVEPNTNLQGPPAAAPLLTIYRRWLDAERLAMSTSRIALAGPVASMQAVQREAEGVSVPACLGDAKKALVDLSAQSTTALIEFMRKNELASMVYTFADRGSLIRAFETSVERASCEKDAQR